METKTAVQLTFETNLGHRYQLQKSTDLVNWVNLVGVIEGTGNKTSRFAEASGSGTYWRLKRLD